MVYEGKCQDCPDDDSNQPYRYIGMTGQSIHARSLTHMKSIKGKESSNSFHKHNLHKHSDSVMNYDRFKFTQLSTHNDNISRYLTEAYKIYHAPDKLINSKTEYNASKWITIDARRTGT